ncbi:type II toxin-antitoxin system antitoxin Phd/YefM family protein [Rhizobium gallicum]|uniref:Type II toxin-antitoxin system antitoxin Phd/YefM family protein n=1 Tax=Rhizobium gallicum TaxID=56730 RepID=A0A1L5NK63_9HYPH|nr:type II toxin-antitoxin system antitoxin Phd/YefM family protein [Rhizobium gallicum]
MEQIAKSAQGALMTVTVCAAKINVFKLIEAARAGEEVVIVKGQKPVAKLAPRADLVSDWFSQRESYRNRSELFRIDGRGGHRSLGR